MEEWRTKPVTLFGHKLWDATITREEIQEELMEKFEEFPAVNFNFSQLIRDNVEEALSGVKGANSIKLFGTDLKVLEEYGQKVADMLEQVRGIKNVGLFHIVGQPNLEIRIDRKACARYGINVADVEAVVQVAIGGKAFTQMVEGEKLYDIVLRLPPHLRDDPNVIAQIPVDVPGRGGQAGLPRPALAAGADQPARAGRVVHLPREQRAGTSRSSSASRTATSRRPSPRRSTRSTSTRRPGSASPTATTSSGRASSPRWRRPTPG